MRFEPPVVLVGWLAGWLLLCSAAVPHSPRILCLLSPVPRLPLSGASVSRVQGSSEQQHRGQDSGVVRQEQLRGVPGGIQVGDMREEEGRAGALRERGAVRTIRRHAQETKRENTRRSTRARRSSSPANTQCHGHILLPFLRCPRSPASEIQRLFFLILTSLFDHWSRSLRMKSMIERRLWHVQNA